MTAMKPVVRDLGQQPTKANLMAAYTGRVLSNMHTVLCMRYRSEEDSMLPVLIIPSLSFALHHFVMGPLFPSPLTLEGE